jgi:CubicO group peptidase (beta-lactamase class C family)
VKQLVSILKLLCISAIVAALWAGLVIAATLQGWFRPSLVTPGDDAAFAAAAIAMLEEENAGNVAYRLLRDGSVVGEHYLSIGDAVDQDTLFQVASLSKWLTAWGVMTLVEAGRLDLDAPVDDYLERWSLPESGFDNGKVTARRLLSHTAGLVDGLGYAGFPPGAEVQDLVQSLTQAADASPGALGSTRVGIEPGTAWEYSGGGFTLLQLLIEEISGRSFEDYMHSAVFQPLGMSRTTFTPDLEATDNIATFYDVDGSVATHFRFTALAAASLYTSAADLTRFLQAHIPGESGESIGRGVLSAESLELMRSPHGSQFGADIWGLGTMLFAEDASGHYVIGHDGSNEPAINTTARINPATGDGIIVLETGSRLLATRLAGEWVFWLTGVLDLLMITMATGRMINVIVVGWLVMLVLALGVWLLRRRREPSAA